MGHRCQSVHLTFASSLREVREESLVGGVDLDVEVPLGEALERGLGEGLHLAEVSGESQGWTGRWGARACPPPCIYYIAILSCPEFLDTLGPLC